MTEQTYIIKRLDKEARGGFSCDNADLDRYFHRQVSQDVRRRVTSCTIAYDDTNQRIAGFFTLSACHVDLERLDDGLRSKLPGYPEVPCVRLGRLAVDNHYKGLKLGAALLAEAVDAALNVAIGIHMMVVDAKDDQAVAFYQHHGFKVDPENPRLLFAPLNVLANALNL